jgi:heat shock protein HspQ
MKVGDLVRHRTYGHTGLILRVDRRESDFLNLLVVWSDWPNLPQANNHTWARRVEIEVISESR